MVRLEKITYERMFNTRMLGRARVISSPRKWHAVNPPEQMTRMFLLTQSIPTNGSILLSEES
jgi:hypothetical protein